MCSTRFLFFCFYFLSRLIFPVYGPSNHANKDKLEVSATVPFSRGVGHYTPTKILPTVQRGVPWKGKSCTNWQITAQQTRLYFKIRVSAVNKPPSKETKKKEGRRSSPPTLIKSTPGFSFPVPAVLLQFPFSFFLSLLCVILRPFSFSFLLLLLPLVIFFVPYCFYSCATHHNTTTTTTTTLAADRGLTSQTRSQQKDIVSNGSSSNLAKTRHTLPPPLIYYNTIHIHISIHYNPFAVPP